MIITGADGRELKLPGRALDRPTICWPSAVETPKGGEHNPIEQHQLYCLLTLPFANSSADILVISAPNWRSIGEPQRSVANVSAIQFIGGPCNFTGQMGVSTDSDDLHTARQRRQRAHSVMVESLPVRPFNEAEALAWLQSQAGGRVTASAAELGRQWGWNRVRAGRRLKAWQDAGHIRRDRETILVTPGVTPVSGPVRGTVTSEQAVTSRSATPVRLAALLTAVALACVSAAFSIDGLTAIFAGAFWPVITMGAALETGKLVATAWLAEHWHAAPRLLRVVLIATVAVLMGLNAVGVFGFLTRAHLDHMVTVEVGLADRMADVEARLAVQTQVVSDLDRRIAHIDAAIEESTRRGRPAGAMALADQTRHDRADLAAARQRELQALADIQREKGKVDAQRKRAEADVGPVRYLAELIGTPSSDLEHPIRLLTLALVAVLDPLAIALLLAAGVR